MSYMLGLDGSQFQGENIDFNQVKAAGYDFWLQRMTYCYPGSTTKIDPTAGKNYYGAKGAGLIVGGYHKVGWTDPIAEADAFLAAMMPLEDGDLLAHDMEPASDAAIPDNWADWEQKYVQRIFDRAGVYSLRYENISMNNSMPKTGVVVNCPSWVAAPSYGWDDSVPVNTSVVIQQGPTAHVPGITANVVDTDAFFGTGSTDELKTELLKLGFHAAQPVPVAQPIPAPAPTPTPTPTPVEPPKPIETPVTPASSTPVENTPTPDSPPAQPQPEPAPAEVPQPPTSLPKQTQGGWLFMPIKLVLKVWDKLLRFFDIRV